MFDVHIHFHQDTEAIKLLTQKLNKMAKTLDEVLQSVTDNATVGDSVITLLNGIKSQLDEALAGEKLSPAAQAKVDAIFEASEADKAKLQEAITANTPADTGTDTGTGDDTGADTGTDTEV